MADRPQDSAAGKGPRPTPASGEARGKADARDARLKAALQANIARRKARGRTLATDAPRGTEDTGPDAAPVASEPDETPPHFTQDLPGAPAPDPSEKD